MYKINKNLYWAAIMLSFTIAGGVAAQEPTAKTVNKTEIAVSIVKADEAVIEVHGIVCSYCSKGVQNKIAKLDFVDTSRFLDGSLVEIEKQRVTVAIKSDSRFDARVIFKAIRDGGYDPVVAYVRDSKGDVKSFRPEEK